MTRCFCFNCFCFLPSLACSKAYTPTVRGYFVKDVPYASMIMHQLTTHILDQLFSQENRVAWETFLFWSNASANSARRTALLILTGKTQWVSEYTISWCSTAVLRYMFDVNQRTMTANDTVQPIRQSACWQLCTWCIAPFFIDCFDDARVIGFRGRRQEKKLE